MIQPWQDLYPEEELLSELHGNSYGNAIGQDEERIIFMAIGALPVQGTIAIDNTRRILYTKITMTTK